MGPQARRSVQRLLLAASVALAGGGAAAVAAPSGAPAGPAAAPGAEIVRAYLAAPTEASARRHVDEELALRSIALSFLSQADPSDPAQLEGTVQALLSAPEEPPPWTARHGCSLEPGTPQDRERAAPLLFRAAASPALRALILEARRQLDRAEAWVARCHGTSDEVFLVDVARRRVVARRERDLPAAEARPGSVLIHPPGHGRPRPLLLEADVAGATLHWRGATRSLPVRLDVIRPEELLGATLRAPGREPHTLGRQSFDAGLPAAPGRPWPGEERWLVVLAPARAASGAP